MAMGAGTRDGWNQAGGCLSKYYTAVTVSTRVAISDGAEEASSNLW